MVVQQKITQMKIKDFFKEQLNYDPEQFAVVMPLTTVIKAEEPEHVIGFAWELDGIKLCTLSKREWETTAAYTGLTSDLYETALLDDIKDCQEFMDILKLPVVAFSKGCTIAALKALNLYAEVIGLPEALATMARRNSNPMTEEKTETIEKTVKWLNSGKPLRKANRVNTLESEEIFIGLDMIDYPVLGSNLMMDRAMWDKVINSDCLTVSEQVNPFDES